MRYVDINQGSQEWLQWRKGGLGGSDAAAILGLSPFKTRERLLLELSGQVEPEQANFAMRRGSRLEPIARKLYEEAHGAYMPPACCEHESLSWMRASLDGLNLAGEILLEIKWPNFEVHSQALNGVVPPYYLCQVQHQLVVSGARLGHYWSCTEHKKFGQEELTALVVIERDVTLERRLVFELGRFWHELEDLRYGAKNQQGLIHQGR